MNSRRFICPSRAGERYEGSIARPKRAVLTPQACPGPGPAGATDGCGIRPGIHTSLSAGIRRIDALPSRRSTQGAIGDGGRRAFGKSPSSSKRPETLHPAVLYVHVICDMSPLLTRDRLT